VDPRPVLRRLFREEAEFVLLDPTEVERPQTRKTEYVGVLQDSGSPRGVLIIPEQQGFIPNRDMDGQSYVCCGYMP
jgi:hypothetical protein